jgi:L-lysine exporter family protein LysE/ArgO
MSAPYLQGIALGGSLIIAIGAQNAFVLKQGLKRSHVLAVVSVCVAVDWVLISLGAAGFGMLVTAFPGVTSIAAWGGATFLFFYGATSFRSAMSDETLDAEGASGRAALTTTGSAIAATAAISLLNPHVYLDTVVLLGSVAAQHPMPERLWFTLGALTASLLWFAGLGFGARLLAPLFRRPAAWRALDILIGFIMWWIAGSLVLGQLG